MLLLWTLLTGQLLLLRQRRLPLRLLGRRRRRLRVLRRGGRGRPLRLRRLLLLRRAGRGLQPGGSRLLLLRRLRRLLRRPRLLPLHISVLLMQLLLALLLLVLLLQVLRRQELGDDGARRLAALAPQLFRQVRELLLRWRLRTSPADGVNSQCQARALQAQHRQSSYAE